MSFPLALDNATWGDSRGPTPGAIALRDYVLANTEHTTSMGIYNYRRVRGGSSPSVHGEGRAFDLGVEAGHRGVGDAVADAMVTHHANLGVQRVIWWERIWSVDKRSAGWRPYAGAAKHRDHVHIELNRAAAAGLTPQILVDTLGGAMATTEPDTEAILDVQRFLLNLGYTCGSGVKGADGSELPDGSYGPTTRASFSAAHREVVWSRDHIKALMARVEELTAAAPAKLSDLSLATRVEIAADTVAELIRAAIPPASQ